MTQATAKLSDEAISRLRSTVPGWDVEDGRLVREFRFDDFQGAVDFVNQVAAEAEAQGHHPDLFLSWGLVRATVTTHSAGGLTSADFELASRINRLQASGRS